MSITHKSGISSFSLRTQENTDKNPQRMLQLEKKLEEQDSVISLLKKQVQDILQANVGLSRETKLLKNETRQIFEDLATIPQENPEFQARLGNLEKSFEELWSSQRSLDTRISVIEPAKSSRKKTKE